MKGGLTPDGAKSTYSHTGSLAGNPEVWRALLHQSGVIQVESLEELEDMVVGLTMLRGLSGSRVGMYAGGGGGMVAAADIFHRYGISLPDLSQENMDELKELIPATWMMMRNPVDVSAMGSPKAGVRLREMLFENYTPVISVYLKRKIEEVLINHEPRIELTGIVINGDDFEQGQASEIVDAGRLASNDIDGNRLRIDIYFNIIGTPSPQSMSMNLQRLR